MKELYRALSRALSSSGVIRKTRSAHRHMYADIHEIMDALGPSLYEEGLRIFSYTRYDRQYNIHILYTYIVHDETEQYIYDERPLRYTMDADPGVDQQNFGKVQTYQRRYALHCLFNLSFVNDRLDDDGQSRSTRASRMLSSKQLGKIKWLLSRNTHLTADSLCQWAKVDRLEAIPADMASKIIDRLDTNE